MKSFKLSLLASAAMLAMTGASQAADVEVYGLIDQGLKVTRDGGENTFEMNPGQIAGSRVGLRIKEDISPDLKVYVNLENGFDADTGAMGDEDRLFNRNSVIGLETKYGTFEAGRTGALVAGVTGGIFAGKVSPFGITWQEAQSSQILSGAVGTRLDNAIRYESPKLAGFNLYAEASNGIALDDSVSSSRKDRYAAVGATYTNGPLMVVAVVDRMFTKNASDDTKSFLGDDYSTFNLGGTYDFGPVKMFLGYQYGDGVTRVGKISSSVNGENTGVDREENTTGYDTHAVVLGANIDLFGGTFKTAGGYVKGERDYDLYSGAAVASKNSDDVEGWQIGIGYLYPLSKRTDLYAGAAYVHQKDTTDTDNYNEAGTLTGTSSEGSNENIRSFIIGMRHKF